MRPSPGIPLILLAAVATAGCFSMTKKKGAAPETIRSVETDRAEVTCAADPGELANRDAKIQQLRSANEHTSLEVLEQRAEIARLEQQLRNQQRILEEAIHEVVRARAKQRSVQSRAQAASEIAEAEIALKRVGSEGPGRSELGQARQLLELATEEFDAENFGGALYLATQAKTRMRSAATRDVPPETRQLAVDGEKAFRSPVPLEVHKRSNFREGPGTEFRVLGKIETGTVVTGYATKGSWVRVRDTGGAIGWIHRSLVRGS